MQARSELYRRRNRAMNSGSSRRRKSETLSRRRRWFPEQPTAVDEPLREVVASHFISMNQEHDRIRMQLLASHTPHDE